MKQLRTLLFFAIIIVIAACSSHDEIDLGTTTNESPSNTSSTNSVSIKPILPARDFRAVWMATVGHIDWPNRVGVGREAEQKAYYTRYLDSLQAMNINAILFQVRPRSDAFYDSPYEPWSQDISGYRGTSPGWNPIPWLISEAHKRGIQFHAWMNPYRIATRSSSSASFPSMDAEKTQYGWPTWDLYKDYATLRIWNPAYEATWNHLDNVLADHIQKFDIDGIHYDDYFYPSLSSGESMGDTWEYNYLKDSRGGFSSIEDFRRANVDSMIVHTQRTIRKNNPYILFSVGPQGNYDNDYNTMYSDLETWSKNGWVDVIMPQLYWSISSGYFQRLDWFEDHCSYDSKVIAGYGIYRWGDGSGYYSSNKELNDQFWYAYSYKGSKNYGAVFYSAHWLLDNPQNINTIIHRQYTTQVVPPYLGHGTESANKPAAPQNLKSNKLTMTWNSVPHCYYGVYRSNGNNVEATLVGVTYENTFTVPSNGYYFVTALTRGLNAQSDISDIIYVDNSTTTGIKAIRR